MTPREREAHVRLEEMSEEQVGIVRDTVLGMLVGKASDLHLLNKALDPRRMVREVAALGRLAFWLEDGEVVVPDRAAREVLADIVEDLDEIDRGLFERYDKAVAQHDALRAFLAYLTDDAGPEGR